MKFGVFIISDVTLASGPFLKYICGILWHDHPKLTNNVTFNVIDIENMSLDYFRTLQVLKRRM